MSKVSELKDQFLLVLVYLELDANFVRQPTSGAIG
jgi:hypothetical protein